MKEKQINVVFRMDDYSARSATDSECRIIDLFRNEGLTLTMGVIPFVCAGNVNDATPQDVLQIPDNKVDILKSAIEDGTLDVALHGYSHQTTTLTKKSEFSGLAYEDQVERILKGKQFLENAVSVPVTTFIPPWNEYDTNTLQALEVLGFLALSAGWKGASVKQSSIRFVPATCGLPQLREAVEAARRCPDEQPLVVVLFHLYDFREFNEKLGKTTIHQVSDLLHWVKSQNDVGPMSIRQAVEGVQDLSIERFIMVERWRSLEVTLPSRLQEEKPILLYHEASIFWRTLVKAGFLYGIIALFFAVAAFTAGLWLFPISEGVFRMATLISITLSAIAIAHSFCRKAVRARGLTMALAAIGVAVGLLFEYMHAKWF